jgi:ribosomal protein L37E
MGETRRASVMRCNRCGRRVWSARAVASGYGEECRRRVYRAVRVLLASGSAVANKAGVLLEDAALVPHGHPSVWRVPSGTDAGRVYLAHPKGCTCPAGLHSTLCYHRVGAIVLAGIGPA